MFEKIRHVFRKIMLANFKGRSGFLREVCDEEGEGFEAVINLDVGPWLLPVTARGPFVAAGAMSVQNWRIFEKVIEPISHQPRLIPETFVSGMVLAR